MKFKEKLAETLNAYDNALESRVLSITARIAYLRVAVTDAGGRLDLTTVRQLIKDGAKVEDFERQLRLGLILDKAIRYRVNIWERVECNRKAWKVLRL